MEKQNSTYLRAVVDYTIEYVSTESISWGYKWDASSLQNSEPRCVDPKIVLRCTLNWLYLLLFLHNQLALRQKTQSN